MTGDKFAFSENCLSLVGTARGLVKSRCERQRMLDTVGRIPVRSGEIGWVQAYERRMWRFNLAVILTALTALISIASWAFSNEAWPSLEVIHNAILQSERDWDEDEGRQ